MEYRLLHTLGEDVAHDIHLLLRGILAILSDKLTDINRLAHLHSYRRAEAEETAVAHTDWHDIEWHVGHQLLRLKCDAEDTLRERQRRVFGLMLSLGEDAEGYSVAQDIDRLVDGLVVAAHLVHPVADAHNGHNLQKSEDLCQNGYLKDIGTRHKDLRTTIHSQHHQRIHQRVGVVRGVDDSAIRRDALASDVADVAVG